MSKFQTKLIRDFQHLPSLCCISPTFGTNIALQQLDPFFLKGLTKTGEISHRQKDCGANLCHAVNERLPLARSEQNMCDEFGTYLQTYEIP